MNDDPLVMRILTLAKRRKTRVLREFAGLIYQPFHLRSHPLIFELLPPLESGVEYYATRQAYRLIAPLMARFPQQGNLPFPRALARLNQHLGQSYITRKLLIIRQMPKLHHAESSILYLITQLKQRNIPINWHQMVTDAKYWNASVAERWLEEFYVVHR